MTIENDLRLEDCPVLDGFRLRGTRMTRIETFTDGAVPASNLGGHTGLGLYDTAFVMPIHGARVRRRRPSP